MHSARSGGRPVSIRDVARASGVSLTTVSLILNRGDQRISEATRQRVLETISRLGYHPNRLAQGLQNRRSHILAILVPQLTHTFADVYFGELISGIYDHANRTGYKILLEVATPSFIRQKRYLELYDRCFVDGMLFMGSNEHHTFVGELAERRRPFVLVNNVVPGINHVVCDYAAAARLAAEHLFELGHRRIGMIHGATDVQTAQQLQLCFVSELDQRGVAVPESCLADGGYSEAGGAAAIEKLLHRTPDLTGIFAGNDKMAIGAMQRLSSMGVRVPGDVSVMGCDDIIQAAYVTPPLTTVHTPLYEIGRRCCQALVDILRGKAESVSEVSPVELVVRASTAPIRQ